MENPFCGSASEHPNLYLEEGVEISNNSKDAKANDHKNSQINLDYYRSGSPYI